MKKLFEYYIENHDLHVKYATGAPARRDMEFHSYNEFVYFIKGNSHLTSKNIQQKLEPGSVVIIPQENYHQFVITEPENYTRCILGFRSTSEINELVTEVMNETRVISTPDKFITDIFEALTEVMTSNLNQNEKLIFAKASLMQLLIRIKRYIPKSKEEARHCTLISKALDIIDERYDEKLSVERIAKLLYVSPSTLSHKFKEELNISVYQYITKKRLSVVHNLICGGEPMTSASAKCGFNDYSCFYRLYKKYYDNV